MIFNAFRWLCQNSETQPLKATRMKPIQIKKFSKIQNLFNILNMNFVKKLLSNLSLRFD